MQWSGILQWFTGKHRIAVVVAVEISANIKLVVVKQMSGVEFFCWRRFTSRFLHQRFGQNLIWCCAIYNVQILLFSAAFLTGHFLKDLLTQCNLQLVQLSISVEACVQSNKLWVMSPIPINRLYVSVCLFEYLSVCFSIHSFTSFYLSLLHTCLYLSVCVFRCLSACLSASLLYQYFSVYTCLHTLVLHAAFTRQQRLFAKQTPVIGGKPNL